MPIFCKNSNRFKQNNYYKNFCSFDIETTNYKTKTMAQGVAIPYLWTFAVNDHEVFYGRTIKEFKEFLDKTNENLQAVLVIYVHNLAYEFQFMRYYFEWNDIFLNGKRRPLKLKYKNIEFRCSYLLSNMSLKNFLINNECEILKLDYDYSIKRYPWDEIKQNELEYCAHDTAGLWQAIDHLMTHDNVNIFTIPLTSTGFVRKDVKKSLDKNTRQYIKNLNDLTPELYTMLHNAFIGGNCHANRFYTGKILNDVYCYDIASSYPYCQLTEKYPITPFKKVNPNNLKMYDDQAYLLKVNFENIVIKDLCDPMPTISKSKCLKINNFELDNGRILSAESLEMDLTDIELNLILDHYDVEKYTILAAYSSKLGYIPECIKSVIYGYYYDKCTLKNSNPYLYAKQKAKLNSIYGMAAFDVGKKRFIYMNDDYILEDTSLNELLKNASEQAEPYTWGVWTTAHARKNLDEVIKLAGDDFIYCDTDSVYAFNELDLTEINNKIAKKSERYSVDYQGKHFIIGKWELDKYCKQFITFGAKKYCYIDGNDNVKTVTAGVSKAAGVKSINDYRLGHIFKNATNKAYYQDYPLSLKIDGHIIELLSSVYIENSDYTLGVSNDYQLLLDYLNDYESGIYFE